MSEEEESQTELLRPWPPLMRAATACAYLEISRSSLTNLQNAGKLIPVNTGVGKRFRRTELDKFIGNLPDWVERSWHKPNKTTPTPKPDTKKTDN